MGVGLGVGSEHADFEGEVGALHVEKCAAKEWQPPIFGVALEEEGLPRRGRPGGVAQARDDCSLVHER